MGIAFCFRSKPFRCSVTDVEKVPPFEVGQEVHMMPSVSQPRLGWSNETPTTVGKIVRIDMDGALNVSMLLIFRHNILCFFSFHCFLFIWKQVTWSHAIRCPSFLRFLVSFFFLLNSLGVSSGKMLDHYIFRYNIVFVSLLGPLRMLTFLLIHLFIH